MFALEIVDADQFVGDADEVKPGNHLAAIDGDRIAVNLDAHGFVCGGWVTLSATLMKHSMH